LFLSPVDFQVLVFDNCVVTTWTILVTNITITGFEGDTIVRTHFYTCKKPIYTMAEIRKIK